MGYLTRPYRTAKFANQLGRRNGSGANWLLRICVAIVLVSPFGAPRSAMADDPAAEQAAQSWALMIGASEYQSRRIWPLKYTANDVHRFAETLNQYAGIPAAHVLKMTDDSKLPNLIPIKKNVLDATAEFLQKPKAGDTVIIYFSGHGGRDGQGRMYLLPVDTDEARLEQTGIPLEWLRGQLATCRAKFKLLIVDACYSGSEKEPEKAATSQDLQKLFEDLQGVVTLASSTANQESLMWKDRQQSVFSYWLCKGLSGHADANGNGRVDVDEIYHYLAFKVPQTAKRQKKDHKQDPVRVIRSGTPGVPVVVALQPQPLTTVISDMAEQLALDLEESGIKSVGIGDFVDQTQLMATVAGTENFGLLAKYLPAKLQEQLIQRGQGRFVVVDRRILQEAMKEQGFAPQNVNSPHALSDLNLRMRGKLPVLAVGKMYARDGWRINLGISLQQTGEIEPVGMVGGFAFLSNDDWAMIGRSVKVEPEDYEAPQPRPDRPVRPASFVSIPRLDERAKEAHPMQPGSPNALPYQMKIFVAGTQGQWQERLPKFKGNDAFVMLNKGEIYQIGIINSSGRETLMRLLVDGLNTLPERLPKDAKGLAVTVSSRRVGLSDARPWTLDAGVPECRVRGFFETINGPESEYKSFKVVDGDESLAARQKFTDQIGIITAVFYLPATAKGLGTSVEDVVRLEKVKPAAPMACGTPLGIIHVRYVDKATYDQL